MNLSVWCCSARKASHVSADRFLWPWRRSSWRAMRAVLGRTFGYRRAKTAHSCLWCCFQERVWHVCKR